MTSAPQGDRVDFTGARAPGDEVLRGRHVRIEPLDPDRHGAGLWAAAAAGDPLLWEYLPYGPFDDAAAFGAWLRSLPTAPDERFHAVLREEDDVPVGMIAYARIAPAQGRVEIAHVWFGAALQRTVGATEAVHLLAAHAFDGLGNRRLEWKCNALNARSRRAAERFGFTYEGTFRQDMVVRGRNRDTAWFSIVDGEWPRVDAAFRAWLHPDNHDADGRQRRTLEELRGTG